MLPPSLPNPTTDIVFSILLTFQDDIYDATIQHGYKFDLLWSFTPHEELLSAFKAKLIHYSDHLFLQGVK
jgi:hypothetical protein